MMCQFLSLLVVCFEIDQVSYFPEVRVVWVCVLRFRWDVSKVGVGVTRVATQVEGVTRHTQGNEFPLDFVDLFSTVHFPRESPSSPEGAALILVLESVLIVLIFLLLRWSFGWLRLWFAFRLFDSCHSCEACWLD